MCITQICQNYDIRRFQKKGSLVYGEFDENHVPRRFAVFKVILKVESFLNNLDLKALQMYQKLNLYAPKVWRKSSS
jgi:hypothetical protein